MAVSQMNMSLIRARVCEIIHTQCIQPPLVLNLSSTTMNKHMKMSLYCARICQLIDHFMHKYQWFQILFSILRHNKLNRDKSDVMMLSAGHFSACNFELFSLTFLLSITIIVSSARCQEIMKRHITVSQT